MSWLYNDLRQTLRDYLGGTQSEIRENQGKRAIRNGLNRVANAYPWPELVFPWRVNVSPSYSTGTITSSDGITFTLAGGTWPTWAAGGLLYADGDTNNPVLIKYRDSGTSILAHTNFAYPGTVTAGSTYELLRVAYPLPADTHSVHMPLGNDRLEVRQIPFNTYHFLLKSSTTSGRPYYYAIGPAPEPYATRALAMWFWPSPNADGDDIETIVTRWFHIPTIDFPSASTSVTVTTAAAVVTLTGGTFPTGIERGHRIRYGTTTALPTEGDLESTIKSRDSNTQLTLETAPATQTAVRFIVSEPIGYDNQPCDEHVFRDVIEKSCMYQFDSTRSGVNAAQAMSMFMEAIVAAKEMANSGPEVSRVGKTSAGRPLRYWKTGDSFIL